MTLSLPAGGVGEPVAVLVHVRDRVTSTVGSSVVLPCNFKSDYSDYTTMDITVIWKVKVFYTGSVLFNVTNRSNGGKDFVDEVHTNVNGRYKLAGDPRQRVASLEVENVTLGDSDQYFCRVEIKRQGLRAFMHESNPGVTLEIIGKNHKHRSVYHCVCQFISPLYLLLLPLLLSVSLLVPLSISVVLAPSSFRSLLPFLILLL